MICRHEAMVKDREVLPVQICLSVCVATFLRRCLERITHGIVAIGTGRVVEIVLQVVELRRDSFE
ncbi:hypothetical protein WJ53_14565 [Burkholderia ubonensis]|uniref:Uncharacterized protein n=1 Tax=Burkholderia ubonensis TaxID=101571 RepID=A0AB73FUM9_9BURK|nr:hypothetical protein WJ53_14565 [Burkholderia ubonensis]KVM37234.1 hypothetical protein WJ54_33515 [Burkholderia ubonensis]